MPRAACAVWVVATAGSVTCLLALAIALGTLGPPARAVSADAADAGGAQLFPVTGSLNSGSTWLDINGIDAGDRRPAALPDGSLLIPLGQAVERLTPDGHLAIAAGQGTECVGVQCPDPPSGDGGPATQAGMSAPIAVAGVPDGGFLIVDESAAVIRRVDAQGIITTVAGGRDTGSYHSDPVGIDGPATQASLVRPDAVAAAPDGRFFIADSGWILRADLDGILRAAAHLPDGTSSSSPRRTTVACCSSPRHRRLPRALACNG